MRLSSNRKHEKGRKIEYLNIVYCESFRIFGITIRQNGWRLLAQVSYESGKFKSQPSTEKPSRTGAHARIAGYSHQSTYLRAWASCAYMTQGLPEPIRSVSDNARAFFVYSADG